MQLRNHAQHQLFALSKGVECTEGLEDNFDFLSPLLAAFPRTSLMPSIPTFKAGSIKWFDCKNGQIIVWVSCCCHRRCSNAWRSATGFSPRERRPSRSRLCVLTLTKKTRAILRQAWAAYQGGCARALAMHALDLTSRSGGSRSSKVRVLKAIIRESGSVEDAGAGSHKARPLLRNCNIE